MSSFGARAPRGRCPFDVDGVPCKHRQAGNVRQPCTVCERCAGEYCFTHANAHVGRTCKAYEKTQREAEAANLWFINQVSKPCPACGIPTQKGDLLTYGLLAAAAVRVSFYGTRVAVAVGRH